MLGTPIPRLSRSSVPQSCPPQLVGPVDEPQAVGIVHLGLGAFSRAHQAQYTELASKITGDRQWGILGVTGRTRQVVDDLAPQGSLYGVLIRSGSEASVHLTGSIVDVASIAETEKVVDAIANPSIRIVTLTITEKAYLLPLSAPVAVLCSGLRQRFASDGGPITVLSCDNVVGNGQVLKDLVMAHAPGDDFRQWLDTSVRFPRTMVDRIVPSTTTEDRLLAEQICGRSDAGLVVAEHFSQWVIENNFAGDRPRWELAGATFVDDVEPFEKAKLRILNGAHSLLAYAGSLAGYELIADAAADPRLARLATELQADARRTLTAPVDLDLDLYSKTVLDRFRDPGLRHTTRQVAMDGSQKLPGRIVATIADSLAAGIVPVGATFAVAAWIAYLMKASRAALVGGPAQLSIDPLSEKLNALILASELDPPRAVRALLGIEQIFPAGVSASAEVQTLIVRYVAELLGDGGGN